MNRNISIALAAGLLVAGAPVASATAMQSPSSKTSLRSGHTLNQPSTHLKIAANLGSHTTKHYAHTRMEPWNNADLGG